MGSSSDVHQYRFGKVSPLPFCLQLHIFTTVTPDMIQKRAAHCIKWRRRLYSTEIFTSEYALVRVFRALLLNFQLIFLWVTVRQMSWEGAWKEKNAVEAKESIQNKDFPTGTWTAISSSIGWWRIAYVKGTLQRARARPKSNVYAHLNSQRPCQCR